jgi:hypothetical protein
MPAPPVRHVPVVGGIAAWHVPLVTTALCVGAAAVGMLETVLVVALLGFAAQTVVRGVVLEVSPVALTRGFVLNRRFVGRTTVLAWTEVVSVHTEFRRPGDDTALITTVRDGAGRSIHFTTAMGLRAYWGCLAAVARRAAAAQRTGVTDAVLADHAPDRRSVVAAAATAGALALVVVAVVGMHYLWAQGRSSIARHLEQSAPQEPAARPGPPPR